MDKIRQSAIEKAKDFLENEPEYRMGYIESEMSNEITRDLSGTFKRSTFDGVRLLCSVDTDMAKRASQTLGKKEFADFANKIRQTLKNGNRVFFSGCGSSGRLSMRLEASWREAIGKLKNKYPAYEKKLDEKLDSVVSIMTGGDYAVIRAAEAFEDSILLGKEQANEKKVSKGDLLVGVTATGETTSILGTAYQALLNGASVYMLICSDVDKIKNKMERARNVYLNENCHVLMLDCGQMALTGSTRMQSSTYEQFAAAVALEKSLYDILKECGEEICDTPYSFYGREFLRMCESIPSEKNVNNIAQLIEKENSIYKGGNFVTYYSNEYLLDVLTDTTERAPTFMTPPFKSSDMKGEDSWAFVKNPTCDTVSAWDKCFARTPLCIEWEKDKYYSLGMTEKQIAKIPDISLKALRKYEIGNEPNTSREGEKNGTLWIDKKRPPAEFERIKNNYGFSGELTLEECGIEFFPTYTDLFEHLCLKMMLNVFSTGTMAKNGRITGNWMTCLAMSNKKLTDRSARIVSDVCGVPYEKALEEVFYSYIYCEEHGILRSPAQDAILRLKNKTEEK